MNQQFMIAMRLLAEEKNLPLETVNSAVEQALAAAYRKDYGDKEQEVRVTLHPETGAMRIFVSREVVEEVENSKTQISLAEAKKKDKNAKIGTEEEPYYIEEEVEAGDFGRVAAQTAKQVILQRLREAEREMIFAEFSDKVDTLLAGVVQRVESNVVHVDLGKATGILFPAEQIPHERYYIGQRVRVYLVRVEQTVRGPQLVLSRSHPKMIEKLFEMEVPEIEAGIVEIKAVARDAGTRSKVAVHSNNPSVDAVGTFVGGRGARVQAVMGEIGDEKIDIVLWNDDPKQFIINALSPTKVTSVEIDEAEGKARVLVPADQLSLAIGKQGQNVRLAAKLTGLDIDIESEGGTVVEQPEPQQQPAEEPAPAKRRNLEDSLMEAVERASEE